MLQFYADKFVNLTTMLVSVAEVWNTINATYLVFDRETDETEIIKIQNNFRNIAMQCEEIGLNVSAMQAKFLCRLFENRISRIKTSDMQSQLHELRKRIQDELSLRQCFILSDLISTEYYQNLIPFGADVSRNFASSDFDIEEASKCFALARYTACVMHLQRVLECGLKAYGNYLGIAALIGQSQPNWNVILAQTRKGIKERNDKSNTIHQWNSDEEKDFCEGIQPFLEAVKTAWRNPSMHADKVYGDEIAKEIFDAVKAFMKHLAKHLDEKGNFTA
jgi:hypothetical protein